MLLLTHYRVASITSALLSGASDDVAVLPSLRSAPFCATSEDSQSLLWLGRAAQDFILQQRVGWGPLCAHLVDALMCELSSSNIVVLDTPLNWGSFFLTIVSAGPPEELDLVSVVVLVHHVLSLPFGSSETVVNRSLWWNIGWISIQSMSVAQLTRVRSHVFSSWQISTW
jgi:hypothetical protein